MTARYTDVHARTAALIFDKAQADVTADERRAAKAINFSVIYGANDSTLARMITRARMMPSFDIIYGNRT